jgi:hypothetical protein
LPLLEHWTGKQARHRYFNGGQIAYLNESTGQQKVQYIDTLIESEKPLDINLKKAGYQTNDLIVIHLINPTLSSDIELIGSLHNGNRQIDWRSSKKSEFRGIANESIFLFIKTADIAGISSRTKLSILLKSIKPGIKTRLEYRFCRANPNLYGPAWFE